LLVERVRGVDEAAEVVVEAFPFVGLARRLARRRRQQQRVAEGIVPE